MNTVYIYIYIYIFRDILMYFIKKHIVCGDCLPPEGMLLANTRLIMTKLKTTTFGVTFFFFPGGNAVDKHIFS